MLNITETKDHILNTSLLLFSTQGFFDTTTKQIAKECGINETTLFYHFPDKATLYQEMINKFYPINTTELETLDSLTYEDIQTDLYTLSRLYTKIILENIHILRIMYSRIPSSPTIQQEYFLIFPQIKAHFNQYIDKLIIKNILNSNKNELSNLYLSTITRYVLDLNLHERISIYSTDVQERLNNKFVSLSKLMMQLYLERNTNVNE